MSKTANQMKIEKLPDGKVWFHYGASMGSQRFDTMDSLAAHVIPWLEKRKESLEKEIVEIEKIRKTVVKEITGKMS
jgi:hypothetical protein